MISSYLGPLGSVVSWLWENPSSPAGKENEGGDAVRPDRDTNLVSRPNTLDEQLMKGVVAAASSIFIHALYDKRIPATLGSLFIVLVSWHGANQLKHIGIMRNIQEAAIATFDNSRTLQKELTKLQGANSKLEENVNELKKLVDDLNQARDGIRDGITDVMAQTQQQLQQLQQKQEQLQQKQEQLQQQQLSPKT